MREKENKLTGRTRRKGWQYWLIGSRESNEEETKKGTEKRGSEMPFFLKKIHYPLLKTKTWNSSSNIKYRISGSYHHCLIRKIHWEIWRCKSCSWNCSSGYSRKILMPSLKCGRASGSSYLEGHTAYTVTGEHVPCHILRSYCNSSMVLLHEHHLISFSMSLLLPLTLSPITNSIFNLFLSPFSFFYLWEIKLCFPTPQPFLYLSLCHVIF